MARVKAGIGLLRAAGACAVIAGGLAGAGSADFNLFLSAYAQARSTGDANAAQPAADRPPDNASARPSPFAAWTKPWLACFPQPNEVLGMLKNFQPKEVPGMLGICFLSLAPKSFSLGNAETVSELRPAKAECTPAAAPTPAESTKPNDNEAESCPDPATTLPLKGLPVQIRVEGKPDAIHIQSGETPSISIYGSPLAWLAAVAAGLLAGAGAMALIERIRVGASSLRRTGGVGEAQAGPAVAASGQGWASDDGFSGEAPHESDQERESVQQIERENSQLRQQLDALRQPHRFRCYTLRSLADEARAALGAAQADAEFERVDASLQIGDSLDAFGKQLALLAALDGSEFNARLLETLRRGELNHALTTGAFLDAYFSERPEYRPLRVSYRAIHALLASLLEEAGIWLLQENILGAVLAANLSESPSADIRDVRAIPTVRHKAQRLSRDLQPGELLVVDCFAPGWSSNGDGPLGFQPARFAVFDLASWT